MRIGGPGPTSPYHRGENEPRGNPPRFEYFDIKEYKFRVNADKEQLKICKVGKFDSDTERTIYSFNADLAKQVQSRLVDTARTLDSNKDSLSGEDLKQANILIQKIDAALSHLHNVMNGGGWGEFDKAVNALNE